MKTKPDKYDRQIARLRKSKNPKDAILNDWRCGKGLFEFCGSGCLTMIRSKVWRKRSFNDKLTQAIRADNRIPSDESTITLQHLPVFAEWQRKIDRMGVR